MNIKELYDTKQYNKIAEMCRDQQILNNFNALDFMHAVSALRKIGDCQTLWQIAQISYAKFPESKRIDTNVGWAIYHLFIKAFDPNTSDFDKLHENIRFIIGRASETFFPEKRKAILGGVEILVKNNRSSNDLKLASIYLDTLIDKEQDEFADSEKIYSLKAEIELSRKREKDLPQPIQAVYNEHFKNKLDTGKIEQFQFEYGKPTIYSGRTLEYTLTYFPLNFYKVWYPLFYLLERRELETHIRILELGTGPGTSTFSTLCFYKNLAEENSKTNFVIDYTAVEKEAEFKSNFDVFKGKFLEFVPENLIIKKIDFVIGDAFETDLKYTENSFDIVLESNLLNNQEGLLEGYISSFNACINRLLKNNGKAILIEPAYFYNQWIEHTSELCSILLPPTKYNVDVGGIQWVKDLFAKGLRYSPKEKHEFYCMILKKGDK